MRRGLRLDLTVNILTNHAINNGRITVFGGEQLRPNIHVEDMTDLYLRLLEAPDEAIDGKTWNAGYHNLKVREIADMVRDEVGKNVDIVVTPTDDHRSYHVSSEKIKRDLGFSARRTVRSTCKARLASDPDNADALEHRSAKPCALQAAKRRRWNLTRVVRLSCITCGRTMSR